MRTRSFALVACLGFASTAVAETHTIHYRVKNLLLDGDCHANALTIASQFQAVTGITSVTPRCTDITPRGQSFELAYEAEEPVKLVTTVDRFVSDGTFETLEDCQAGIADEESHFVSATGLTPVIATCQTVELGRRRPFQVLVESFGEPEVKPSIAWTIVMDRPVDLEFEDLLQNLSDALTTRGVDVRSVNISGGMLADLYIRYYAKDRLNITDAELAVLRTIDQCHEQLTFAEAVTFGRSAPPLTMYCAVGALNSYYVKGFFESGDGSAGFLSAERFESYEECMAARETLISDYDTRMGGTVGGGVCTIAEGTWRIRMFTR